MNRAEMLTQLADMIANVERPYPVRVAIDGMDAAGNTTLANELKTALESRGGRVIRATMHVSNAHRRDGPYYHASWRDFGTRNIAHSIRGPHAMFPA